MSKQTGSIELSDMEPEEMSEGERAEYAAAISAVFPRLEKDIKRFKFFQLLFQGEQCENMHQLMFSRGTINGFNLLLEHWQQAHVEHTNKGKKDEFDKLNPIGELED